MKMDKFTGWNGYFLFFCFFVLFLSQMGNPIGVFCEENIHYMLSGGFIIAIIPVLFPCTFDRYFPKSLMVFGYILLGLLGIFTIVLIVKNIFFF